MVEPSLSSTAKEREEWKPSISLGGLTHLGNCMIVRLEMTGLWRRALSRSSEVQTGLLQSWQVRTPTRMIFDHGMFQEISALMSRFSALMIGRWFFNRVGRVLVVNKRIQLPAMLQCTPMALRLGVVVMHASSLLMLSTRIFPMGCSLMEGRGGWPLYLTTNLVGLKGLVFWVFQQTWRCVCALDGSRVVIIDPYIGCEGGACWKGQSCVLWFS